MEAVVYEGDCLKVMDDFENDVFDAIITDPPYGLKFMGKEWDHGIPGIPFWQEALRVSKPGSHMLAFGGTRTHHRLMVAIEDAGWEIRDCLMWVYGSGFPKSLDISKSLDKTAGAERDVVGTRTRVYGYKKDYPNSFDNALFDVGGNNKVTAPATDAAKQWNGWGTALKPAWEIIVMCRKPLEGTVAQNVQKWGTGAINIDACRVEGTKGSGVWGSSNKTCQDGRIFNQSPLGDGYKSEFNPKGRFPANFVHDGSEEVIGLFPDTQPSKGKYVRKTGNDQFLGVMGDGRTNDPDGLCDSGSASRFFYCAKASRTERNIGLEDPGHQFKHGVNAEKKGNIHPTVKPVELLRYLCRLITPRNGVILDPFAGSGTTGIASTKEGFNSILVELIPEYVNIARKRNAPEDPNQKTLNGK